MPDPIAPSAKRPFRFWSFFFSTQGRVSRVPYALFVPLIQGLIFAASFATSYFMSRTELMARATVLATIGLFAFMILWPHFAVTSKRLRDAALSPWPAALLFVPFITGLGFSVFSIASLYGSFLPKQDVLQITKYYNFFSFYFKIFTLAAMCVLAFIPGTKGANRYGPNPLNPDQSTTDVF